MSKGKEIKEIKQVLINACEHCRTIQEDYMQDKYAQSLVNAGYRKADEVRKETAREVASEICVKVINGIYKCDLNVETVKKLGKKYGLKFD